MPADAMSGVLPARAFVQASSHSWSGGTDLCVSEVDGVPAFVRTTRALESALPGVPVVVIAPRFDRDGALQSHLRRHGAPGVPVWFGDDGSPLHRMVDATGDLSPDAWILRINGLNLFVDPRTIRAMCASFAQAPVDCLKVHDDYPAALALDLYRVGALRRALAELQDGSPFHVHPKYHMQADPTYVTRCHDRALFYTDDDLRGFRKKARQLQAVDHQDVGDRYVVAAGDQLRFHYELALQWIRPGSDVLDIACGPGYGAALLADVAETVIGGDIDEQALAAARTRFGRVPGLELRHMDALATGLPDECVDHVTSFETIEHVDDIPRYLRELRRVLRPGGTLFISTPQNCHGHVPLTWWHRRELSLDELTAEVVREFHVVERIGIKQGRIWFPGDPVGNNSFFVASPRR